LGLLSKRRTRIDSLNRNNPRFDGKHLSRQLCSREALLDHFGLLLQTTLDEESEANELLNNLAEDIVNPEALMEPELAGASSDR
jgi:hypothetical protein